MGKIEVLKYYITISLLSLVIPYLLIAGNTLIFGKYQLLILFSMLIKILIINSSNFLYLLKKINKYFVAFCSSILIQISSYIYFEKFTHYPQGYDFSYIYPTFVSAFNIALNILLVVFFLSKNQITNEED